MPTFDDSIPKRQPTAWEPEPLHLPAELPRAPERRKQEDDEGDPSGTPAVVPAGAIVIDLC